MKRGHYHHPNPAHPRRVQRMPRSEKPRAVDSLPKLPVTEHLLRRLSVLAFIDYHYTGCAAAWQEAARSWAKELTQHKRRLQIIE